MATVRQEIRRGKDSRIYLKEISVQQEIGRSAENIPRVFGSNFETCSSVDQKVGDLRRTRSFTLPRVLKKERDTPTLIQIVFGKKTRLKKTNSKCATLLTSNGKDKGLNQKANCTKVSTLASKTDGSRLKQNNFIIPTICIQPPEEMNKSSYLTQPITITIQADTTEQLTHDQIKESTENPKQASTLHLKKSTTTDKNDIRTTPRRKRSFSWSDVYSSGDLKINPAEVLKSSSSWGEFLNSAARETDLCSTDL